MVSCICLNKKTEQSRSHYEGFLGPVPIEGGGDEPGKHKLAKVFVSRLIDPEAIRQLKLKYHVELWDTEEVIPRPTLIRCVEGCTVIVSTTSDIIDMEVLEAAGPQLSLVCNMASDLSNVDVAACERRSVSVHCAGEVCVEAVAELTCALLLMVQRRLMEGCEAAHRGQWDLPLYGYAMTNRVLGFLGFGPVGWEVASRMQPFDLSRIIYYDKETHPIAKDVNAEQVSLEDVFSLSDLIVCTLALSSETKGIVNAEKFNMCKSECIFVNTSRGALVNHDDLVAALESKQIAGAGLDVTHPQPLPTDHPLLKLPNCIVTPHMGSATYQTRLKMALSVVNAALGLCS
ncbi:glyoxylate reductase/hydroxypyruvate reductase [Biomphalaria pfeifferi]|uniref:Glyoxylate reductase/hydroxypyruvate reductase n=1 Tax=Biomphalaria pfeifferi TaxID=112525 RepID=A0AAD8AS00_BIOPF|nr:glyoxylate reductase/hydroxypyruvate reductase [Biomphalaria pfeifferi]